MVVHEQHAAAVFGNGATKDFTGMDLSALDQAERDDLIGVLEITGRQQDRKQRRLARRSDLAG